MLKIKQKQKEISIKWNSCKLIADLRRSDARKTIDLKSLFLCVKALYEIYLFHKQPRKRPYPNVIPYDLSVILHSAAASQLNVAGYSSSPLPYGDVLPNESLHSLFL